MLKKTIEYVDFNGTERKEDYYFHFTQAEVAEMELSADGGAGLQDYINKVKDAKDSKTLINVFKEVLLKAYGEKSADGRRFIKITPEGHRLADDFAQTEAYSILFMELAFDAQKAADFFNGVVSKPKQNSQLSNR